MNAARRQLARDGRLEVFANLHETRKSGIAAWRIMRLTAKQEPALMFGKHDHYRIDAGIMLGAALRAAARPAAPHNFAETSAIGTETVAAMPPRQA